MPSALRRVQFVGWQIDPGPYYRSCASGGLCLAPGDLRKNRPSRLGPTRAVLSTRTAGPLEIITTGRTARVPAEDPRPRAGARTTAQDLGARHYLGEAGRSRLALDFSAASGSCSNIRRSRGPAALSASGHGRRANRLRRPRPPLIP